MTPTPPPWHARAAADVAAALDVDPARGLTAVEAARRLAATGPNRLPAARQRGVAALVASQFASPLIYLLFAAAALALALGELEDAIVIAAVVTLNAVIGALQEGRAERSLAALHALATGTARVVRDGREQTVDAAAVVPGDLLVLDAGDAVRADARVIEAAGARAAEAALTGEAVPVDKGPAPVAADAALGDRGSLLHAGTALTAGRARAVVVATGSLTELGRIAALAAAVKQPPTPLERRIAQFGRAVIVAAAATFAVVLAIGLARGVALAQIVMVATSQVVGLVPEGLPVAMTIALAVGVQRMARRRVVVRRLAAVETLGSTTVICTDKTGTLTENRMTAVTVWLPAGGRRDVVGRGGLPAADARPLLEAAALCSDASVDDDGEVGDPTEIALVRLARDSGVDLAALRARCPRTAEEPFDPARKRMATAHADGARRFVVVKGAPEAVLALTARPDAPDARAAADALAGDALRVLAVGIVDDAALAPGDGLAALAGRVRLLGLIGQVDPPRPEVADAVARCRAAGIRVVVVTGDHPATALAIARGLGLPHARALTGADIDALDAAGLGAALADTAVCARVHPEHKLRIVAALQARGEVVAMTGDGVNDAPALVEADVGVAMGRGGTEVARQAAKIVLTDDNFASIVAAAEEGRVVYRNLKKAILLLFSTSAAEVVILIAALALGYPPPFAAVQILWNNLVTEGLVTVNLVMEPAEGDELASPPVPPGEPLLTRALALRMALMVPTITAVTLGWLAWRTADGVPAAQVQTETFTLLALCEWWNVLNCRSQTRSALRLDVLRNAWLVGGLLLGNALQLAVVYWAPLGRWFHTTPFGWRVAVALGAVASLVLWVEELRKWFARRAGRGR